MIQAEYTCEKCKVNRKVNIVEKGPSEATGPWMREIILKLLSDHKLASPTCKNNQMSQLKIPLETV